MRFHANQMIYLFILVVPVAIFLAVKTLSRRSKFTVLHTNHFTPSSNEKINSTVKELIEQAMAFRIGKSGVLYLDLIKEVIARIDIQLSDQLNEIIHHPDFTRLEGTWRGLHHLVLNTETGPDLKIEVVNISKRDLARSLSSYAGGVWDISPLYNNIFGIRAGTMGSYPYSFLVGDYQFDHKHADIWTLSHLSRICERACCPFIASVIPSFFNRESWPLVFERRDLHTILDDPEYKSWNELRRRNASRFIGLTLSGFLGRAPYKRTLSESNEPAFGFDEDMLALDKSQLDWSSSAYLMAANITRAYRKSGWCAQICGLESGGIVDNLPAKEVHIGENEIATLLSPKQNSRRECELNNLGFIPLSEAGHCTVFFSANSVYNPVQYQDPDATAAAKMITQFGYMFALCRFAHYVLCIARDKLSRSCTREQMERHLNCSLMQFVADSGAGEETKAERPLSGSEVTIQEDPDDSQAYIVRLTSRPHFQLKVPPIGLSMNVWLPRG